MLGHPVSVQAAFFIAIGAMNTILDLGIYIALTRSLPLFSAHIALAKALSFFLASISSFFLNRRFTFGLREKVRAAEVARFYATVAIGLVINVSTLAILVSGFHVFDLIAAGVATVVSFSWNFSISRLWVFKKRTDVRK